MNIPELRKAWFMDSTKDKDLAKSVVEAIDTIDKAEGTERRKEIENYLRMYGGRNAAGLALGTYYKLSATKYDSANDRLRWNVVKAAADTVQARVAKNTPAPMFLTEKGDFSVQLQAKRLSQYIKGVFYQTKLYEMGPEIFRDAQLVGTGVAKVYFDAIDECIQIERCFPWELYVDPIESVYGKPRSLYQIKFVDRDQLLATFPDKEYDIQRADAETSEMSRSGTLTSDLIKVYEAWHLSSSKNAKDGRHVICIADTVLADNAYTRTQFPFAFLRWNTRSIGFWGQGLVEELAPMQLEINKLLRSIQMNHHLGSNPIILKERGSKIEEGHFNNQKFNIVDYTGTPPNVVAFTTTNPEIYQHLETLYNRAFEIAGVSQLSSGGQIPAAIQGSGRSMLVYNDIESARFNMISKRYEQFFMDLSDQIVELSKMAYEDGVDIKVTGTVKRRRSEFIESVKWSEVDLKEQSFEMRLFPVSSMPDTPPGKLAFLKELSEILPIDPAILVRLMNFPDVDAFIDQEIAGVDVIYDAIESMIEDGKYIAPEPFDTPGMGVKLANQAYARARIDGVPEERLQLLRDYVQAAISLQTPSTPPAPEVPAAPEAPMGPLGPVPELPPEEMPMDMAA